MKERRNHPRKTIRIEEEKDLCYIDCATIRKSTNIQLQQITLHNHALQIYNCNAGWLTSATFFLLLILRWRLLLLRQCSMHSFIGNAFKLNKTLRWIVCVQLTMRWIFSFFFCNLEENCTSHHIASHTCFLLMSE